MKISSLNQNVVALVIFILATGLPSYVAASEDFTSQLVNQSNKADADGFKLVKTREWPSARCLIDSGKQVIYPGETTTLKIKNSKECNESGIGYSIYKVDDKDNKHLFGYMSHRFANGKFSVQISRFCEGQQCVFSGLNPEQKK